MMIIVCIHVRVLQRSGSSRIFIFLLLPGSDRSSAWWLGDDPYNRWIGFSGVRRMFFFRYRRLAPCRSSFRRRFHVGTDFVEGRGEVKRVLRNSAAESALMFPELLLRCTSNALSVLRNALILYETCGTGSECSGENLQNSTPIQVLLTHWWNRFRCTHRPPRARSRISQNTDRELRFKFNLFSEVHQSEPL